MRTPLKPCFRALLHVEPLFFPSLFLTDSQSDNSLLPCLWQKTNRTFPLGTKDDSCLRRLSRRDSNLTLPQMMDLGHSKHATDVDSLGGQHASANNSSSSSSAKRSHDGSLLRDPISFNIARPFPATSLPLRCCVCERASFSILKTAAASTLLCGNGRRHFWTGSLSSSRRGRQPPLAARTRHGQ